MNFVYLLTHLKEDTTMSLLSYIEFDEFFFPLLNSCCLFVSSAVRMLAEDFMFNFAFRMNPIEIVSIESKLSLRCSEHNLRNNLFYVHLRSCVYVSL